MTVHVGGAGVVGGHCEVGRTGVSPLGGVALPALGRPAGELRLSLDAEAVHRQAGALAVAADRLDGVEGLVRAAERHPPVAEERAPFQDARRRSAEPQRDGSRRSGVDAGGVNGVERAGVVHDVFRPQQAHHLDLLDLASAPIAEGLVQRHVFDGVPPGADAEAEAVAGHDGDLGSLLGDEHGLALRQDEHRRGELEVAGEGGGEGEERERLVEADVLVVGALEAAGAVRVGPDDVVVGEQVTHAQLLDPLDVGADAPRGRRRSRGGEGLLRVPSAPERNGCRRSDESLGSRSLDAPTQPGSAAGAVRSVV